MKKFIEIHVLQNYAPSNLNRDDTGAPKDTFFGGYNRARISSQCIKSSVRNFFHQKIDKYNLGIRTKRLHNAILEFFEEDSNREENLEKIKIALFCSGAEIKEGKTSCLMFLEKREIEKIANVIKDLIKEKKLEFSVSYEDLKKIINKKKSKKKLTKEEELELKKYNKITKKKFEEFLGGGDSVDLALFGRMLADMPSKNRYAASQVAHAISTNIIKRDFDFYVAIDDLKPDDISGADMMGTVEFNSSCFYRYALVDYEKLVKNLNEDEDLSLKGLEVFLEGFIVATPTGKQNSFAAHNVPEYVLISVREEGIPCNLANAFEVPVRVKKDESLTLASIKRLVEKNKKIKEVYGNGKENEFYLDLLGSKDVSGTSMNSLSELLKTVIDVVKDSKGGK